MDIDDKIKCLMFEKSFLKMEINSNYGTNHISVVTELFIRRNKITEEIKQLHFLKKRKLKLDKIKQKMESMEV